MYSKLPPPLDGQIQTAVSLLVYKASLVKTCNTSLPASVPFSNAAPFWASIVRDVVITRLPPAVNKSNFLALYVLCVDFGLQARVTIKYQTGSQEITIFFRIIASSTDATAPAGGRHHRCRRRCAQAHTTAGMNVPQPDFTSPREASFPSGAISPFSCCHLSACSAP
jgi:hypothetical protein